MLYQLQLADIFVKFFLGQSKPLAVDACCSEEAVRLIEEDWMVDRNRQLNMARVARAIDLVEVTCRASNGPC